MEIKKRRKRGRPPKNQSQMTETPVEIDFSQIGTLNNLNIDPRMLESMPTKMKNVDEFLSHEGGVPCATNIMTIGDPGVGKTTILLDVLASIQNNGRKCLFISGEMGRKQMYKYTQRFPQFGIVNTLFTSDFLDYNTKDVIEQVLKLGYDCVLIDSIAEIISGVRDDNGWDRKSAESWLVDICIKNNKGQNDSGIFTTFLLIQQVTKGGEFVGSNKLKHMTDATLEMRRDSDRDGGSTYMKFTKNRNGEVEKRINFHFGLKGIEYGMITDA